MSPFYKDFIDDIPELSNSYNVLDKRSLIAYHEQILLQYFDFPGKLNYSKIDKKFMITGLCQFKITEILLTLNINLHDNIIVIWISFNQGISLTFILFARNILEFWNAGADDIWIFPTNNSWLLQIGHEGDVVYLHNEKTQENRGAK